MTITKKISGRPRKGEQPYDQYMGFICSKKESDKYREVAKNLRLSLSEFIRETLNEKVDINNEDQTRNQ